MGLHQGSPQEASIQPQPTAALPQEKRSLTLSLRKAFLKGVLLLLLLLPLQLLLDLRLDAESLV